MPAGLKQQQLLMGSRRLRTLRSQCQGSNCSNQISQQQKGLPDCMLSSKHCPNLDEYVQINATVGSSVAHMLLLSPGTHPLTNQPKGTRSTGLAQH